MYYYYTLLFIFALVAYMIAVDSNVATYVVLLYKLLRINIIRMPFMVKMYPRLLFDSWSIKRRLDKSRKDAL
jgi:hypothetical protein